MNILQITSSIKEKNSHSTRLSGLIIDKLKENTKATVITRNLRETALPHFSEVHLKAFATHQEIDTVEREKIIQLSDELIQEILDADVIVISMYNVQPYHSNDAQIMDRFYCTHWKNIPLHPRRLSRPYRK